MSSPAISIIITTKNSAATLEPLLESIRAQSIKSETIVVDNQSNDGTKEIAHRFTPLVFDQGPERSAQRNFGASKATTEFLLILDSDMVLGPRVLEQCLEGFQRSEKKALVIPEESFGSGYWASCKVLERSYYVGQAWMEAARCFRRSVFEEFYGYDEENTGTEDYDLPQRIEAKYGREAIGRVSEPIRHSEEGLTLLGTCRKKFYYAKDLVRYQSRSENQDRFSEQASLWRRYRLFLSEPKRLLKDPLVGAGMLLMKTAEFGSGAAGFLVGKLRR